MKKTVKLLAMLLALALIFGAFGCAVMAAAPAKGVVLSGDATANPGDTYVLDVVIKGGVSYTNIEFQVNYDAAYYSLVEVVIGGAMPAIVAKNPVAGAVKFAAASDSAITLTNDGVLATLKLKVNDAAADDGDDAANVSVSTTKLNNKGTKVYADGVADDQKTVTIVHAHDFKTKNDAESQAPECVVPGFDRFYCACGQYKDTPIDGTGHTYVNVWTPVAGMDGWFENKCNDCSESIKTYVPADVTSDEFGATVKVEKGVFSEKVTTVISAVDAGVNDDIEDVLGDTADDFYAFSVDFVDDSGASVALLPGTKYDLTLKILSKIADLDDYKVAKYDATEGKLVKLSDKVDGDEIALALDAAAVIVVYGADEPISSEPDSGSSSTPSQGGTSSNPPSGNTSSNDTPSSNVSKPDAPVESAPAGDNSGDSDPDDAIPETSVPEKDETPEADDDVTTPDKDDTTANDTDKPADTSDNSVLSIAIIVLVLASITLGATVVLKKKRA